MYLNKMVWHQYPMVIIADSNSDVDNWPEWGLSKQEEEYAFSKDTVFIATAPDWSYIQDYDPYITFIVTNKFSKIQNQIHKKNYILIFESFLETTSQKLLFEEQDDSEKKKVYGFSLDVQKKTKINIWGAEELMARRELIILLDTHE